MYCTECGTVIDDNAVFCSNCGKRVKGTYNASTVAPTYNDDSSGIGFAIAGFLVPICGLILYLAERKDRPQKAKSAGIGALVRLGINFVITVILLVVYFEMFGSFYDIFYNIF